MDTNLRLALSNDDVTANHNYSISMDVAEGLKYLHSIRPHPLIHRDVSAPNVLLKADGKGWIVKLSDLGSAQFAQIAQTFAPGAIIYTAPEVKQRESALHQTIKIDIYSFGVLLIEMLTKQVPTDGIEVLMGSIDTNWNNYVSIITSCTNVNPDNRPSIEEVIKLLQLAVADDKYV